MKRENGYYWVKLDTLEWVIAEYKGTINKYWYLHGNEKPYRDFDFKEINENRILLYISDF